MNNFKRKISMVIVFIMTIMLFTLPIGKVSALETHVSDADELSSVLASNDHAKADKIVLDSDITVDSELVWSIYAYGTTFDLNGHTLNLQNNQFKLWIYNDSIITFTDSSALKTGKITGSHSNYQVSAISNELMGNHAFTLIFDGGTYEGSTANGSFLYVWGDNEQTQNIVFRNGTFTNYLTLYGTSEVENIVFEGMVRKNTTDTAIRIAYDDTPVSNLLEFKHSLTYYDNEHNLITATTETLNDITINKNYDLNVTLDDGYKQVNFNTNGGNYMPSLTILAGETMPGLDDPTKDGNIFAGWYSDSTFTTSFSFTTPITENTTIYAKWDLAIHIASGTITLPVAGEHPVMTGTTTDTNYTFQEVSFYDGGTELTVDDVFEEGKTYTIYAEFRPNSGYQFNSYSVATINDLPANFYNIIGDGYHTTVFSFNYTLDAVSEETGYTLTVLTNNPACQVEHNLVSYDSGQTYELDAGEQINLYARAAEGYLFTGVTAEEGIVAENGSIGRIITMPAHDTTITFNFVASHTVTFDTTGGSAISEQVVADNGNASEPDEPNRDGYIFAGWCEDSTCTTEFDFSASITQDVTIYAKWKEAIANVDITGVTNPVIGEAPTIDGINTNSEHVHVNTSNSYWMYKDTEEEDWHEYEGETFVVNKIYGIHIIIDTDEDYAFTNPVDVTINGMDADAVMDWGVDNQDRGINHSFGLLEEPGETVTITIDMNGGIPLEQSEFVLPKGIRADEVEIEINPQHSDPNKVPAGIFTSPEGGDPIDGDYVFDHDQTLYFQWVDAVYRTVTLNYMIAGDETDLHEIDVLDGSLIPFDSLPELEWEGHAFDGWYEDSTYVTRFEFEERFIHEDTMLYAKWTDILTSVNITLEQPIIGDEITVSYNPEHEMDEPNLHPDFRTEDDEYELINTAWVNGICGGESHQCEELFEGVFAEDTWYYAAVTIHAKDDYGVDQSIIDNDGIRINGELPEGIILRDDHKDILIVTKIQAKEATPGDDPNPGDEPGPQPTTSTLTFDTNGGTPIDSITEENGVVIDLPIPERIGYTFVEWYQVDEENNRYLPGDQYEFIEDTVLIAKWEIIKLTATFDLNGGTIGDKTSIDKQFNYGEAIEQLEDIPEREGYAFAGWSKIEAVINENTGESDGAMYEFTQTETVNTVICANWRKIYHVTFNTEPIMPNPEPVEVAAGMSPEYPIPELIPYEVENYRVEDFYLDNLHTTPYAGEEITSDTIIYVNWEVVEEPDEPLEEITKVELQITPPKVGDTTTTPKDSEYDMWLWGDQTNQLAMTVADGSNYTLDGEHYMFFIVGYEDEDYDTPFIGTFEKGKTYYTDIFLTAKDGYKFAENCQIIINGEETGRILAVYGINDQYLELGVDVVPTANSYTILEGANQQYTANLDNDLTVKADGNLDDVTNVLVDNEELDDANYILESGSTIVTLKKAYLSTLDKGVHTLTVVYNDGEVSTNFEILENTPSNNPQTSDSIYIWFIMLFISLIAMPTLVIKLKKH